jgi:hypothetical protein
MKNYRSRNDELKSKLNSHLHKMTGLKTDFYSALKHEDILDLKTVLSDINNLLTFKLTLAAGAWIGDYFSLNENEKQLILNKIDSIKPNEQGFDILIQQPIKLIAEVKCNIPVKQGSKFGAMQAKKLLEDVEKLLSGKKQLRETDSFLKFVFVIDLGKRSSDAVLDLVRIHKINKENEERLNRNVLREQMIILNKNDQPENLRYDKVYIKVLELK